MSNNEVIFPKRENIINEINIDTKKLRPGNSYSDLFRNRDYAIRKIVDEHDGVIPEKWLVHRNCPLCDGLNYEFFLSKDFFSLVKCLDCDLVYVNPTLKSEKYIEVYQNENYGHIIESISISSHEYRRERFGKERLDIIESKFQKTAGKLLDIGSASGFF
jgi:hypothetical protein